MTSLRFPLGIQWGAAALASLLMVGCTSLDVPRAVNYPLSDQHKARAVHHWDVLAADVAYRIADKIREWPADQYPIYIPHAGDDNDFNHGFRKLLITQLLNRGVVLANEPTAVTLSFSTQVVRHPAELPVGAISTSWTQLSPGVGVSRDAQRSAAMTTGTGSTDSIAPYGDAAGGPTRSEVLITTALESAGRYLAGTSDIYYVEQADAALYLMAPPPPPPPPPLPPLPETRVKTWRVVTP